MEQDCGRRSDDIKYFSANLKNTVRDNPVPLILMGVSLVWMMTGSNNRKVYRYAAGEQYRQDGSSKGLGRKYQRVKSTVSEKAEDLGDSLKEKYSDVKGRAEEAFDHAGQKISGAKESAGDTLDDAGRTISRTSDRVGDRADDLHRRGREFWPGNPAKGLRSLWQTVPACRSRNSTRAELPP